MAWNDRYGMADNLSAAFDKRGRRRGFAAKSPLEAREWAASLRPELGSLIGLDRLERVEPEARLLESEACEGFRRDKLEISAERDVRMPFYALLPEGLARGERRPCVIAAHGHMGGGKLSVAGVDGIPAVRRAIEAYNSDYGAALAREGFVVLCPDARGMGQRRGVFAGESDEDFVRSCSCRELSHMAGGLGLTVTGLWTWDLLRLVDYALSRPDCDPERIAAVGFSSGGQQALWLAALDERIRCAIVSGYFYGYKDSLFGLPGNCSCNYVPRLWEHIDMGDLGALIAPRPLLIESGRSDPLNGSRGVANAEAQVAIARRAYEVYGLSEALLHLVFEGGHVWWGKEAAGFLRRSMP